MRDVIAQTTGGRNARVNFDKLRDALYMTYQDSARWTVFQCIENHDLLDFNHTGRDRQPRIAALADPSNARSWYARSRAKVATGLLLTAPGVPMIFMGQEFLEDKYWTDWPGRPELLIWWDGLAGKDKHMSDQHRFTRDLMWLRRKHPALRGEGINVFHVHNDNRVIAIHRWLPGVGRDVVVVASLNESTFYNQRLSPRLSWRWPLARGVQQRHLRSVVQSERAGQSRRHHGRRTGMGWSADLCGNHTAGKQCSDVRARRGRFLTEVSWPLRDR